ncbi:ATP-binding protein [Streptomyces sp. NBC_00249]|uniref:ATP-binding protein n=1 Tax=Streptomyces sp. NBC_00249 TaxID=2975690 RepID=UPI002252D6D3|nr:ATP-binding protein [Streptomyces sp. NBC_00249]MCX5196121.1 ATP-binding protein [Streptomyces sp. NBC_00249]
MAAEQTRRLVLAGATSGVVARCRDFTRAALAEWRWPPGEGPAEDVVLLVSELVTNACLHADGPRELLLRHTPGRLRVEVTDDNPQPPAPGPAGRGLALLDRLAAGWGSTPAEGDRPGKTVWLEVTAAPPATG